MKSLLAVIGARPQFIKHAPMELALMQKLEVVTVHTGQHYDHNMSAVFFDELKMQKPKYQLQVGSASHGRQTGQMMQELEAVMEREHPGAVLVYGDTNSTLAGALVAAKMHIPVIHIEAGLRSFNRDMPEEINRVITDHVSDLLFAPTDVAIDNLAQEGITNNVYRCGDIMRDAIRIARDLISEPAPDQPYYFVTLHRPYNTDDPERLQDILQMLNQLDLTVVFAMHPRTKNHLVEQDYDFAGLPNVTIIDPVSYFDCIAYQVCAEAVITDSGGMQKEAYMLGKKCITIRPETEWVETLEHGWNTLVYDDLSALALALKNKPGLHQDDLYGDGRAAEEIAGVIKEFMDCGG
ncbi:MAG: UDP-N-acetylglucosamine 2-epimerase (non-hydrolyzing) [Ignavibacteria bacterium]|nr:UDP-N-acetylglucosamine 2-epimerase (non-hydrolyzing) [Ignavibacteria bacterium]